MLEPDYPHQSELDELQKLDPEKINMMESETDKPTLQEPLSEHGVLKTSEPDTLKLDIPSESDTSQPNQYLNLKHKQWKLQSIQAAITVQNTTTMEKGTTPGKEATSEKEASTEKCD